MAETAQAVFIIPLYNEENRIATDEYEAAFNLSGSVDFLLVNDGSTDKTLPILEQFASRFPQVKILNLTENAGKAEAIRKGILSVRNDYEYIGYLDADFATPVSEMLVLLRFAKSHPHFDIVMGTRIKLLGNQVERSIVRHYLGRIFATVISACILKIPVYDTQCGAKIIRSGRNLSVFEKPFLTRWLFDVEMLLRFKAISGDLSKNVSEFPLSVWKEKGQTKIRFTEFISFPFQLLKIYFSYVR